MLYTIRLAQASDSLALAHLLHDIGYFWLVNNETESETQVRVLHNLSMCLEDYSHSTFVACQDDEILGYASVHWNPYLFHNGPDGYVSELFIRPSARGSGIGGSLLTSIVDEGRRRGCSRLLLLNVKTRESYMRGFYKKHGWEEWEDVAVFHLAL